METAFFRDSIGYAQLSWKRMIPGLSDTVATLVLGVLVLQAASVVLIATLAINIALGSFCSLVMLHRDGSKAKEAEFASMLQGAIIGSLVMAALAVGAAAIFEPEVGRQSFWFLIISIPRLFILCWNVYCGEILFRGGLRGVVQRIITISILVYVVVSWLTLGVFTYFGITPSITFLLIAAYCSLCNTALRGRQAIAREARLHSGDIPAVLSATLKIPANISGIGVALATAFANVMELGFLALAGWIVVALFQEVSVVYFPLVNMFEWVSGFALGLSRVYTERLIRNEQVPSYSKSSVFYAIYAIFFSSVYLWAVAQISPPLKGIGLGMIIFAVSYVLLDGFQLILSSRLQADPDGRSMMWISILSYVPAFVGLGASFVSRNSLVFLISLLIPLCLEILLLNITASQARVRRNA